MANKPLIIWSDDAAEDNDYYTTWYLNIAGPNISIKFTETIDKAIKLIVENPYSGRSRDSASPKSTSREYVVRKFPFILEYQIKSEQEIVITALFHDKRNRPQ